MVVENDWVIRKKASDLKHVYALSTRRKVQTSQLTATSKQAVSCALAEQQDPINSFSGPSASERFVNNVCTLRRIPRFQALGDC